MIITMPSRGKNRHKRQRPACSVFPRLRIYCLHLRPNFHHRQGAFDRHVLPYRPLFLPRMPPAMSRDQTQTSTVTKRKKPPACDYCKARRVICHPQPDGKPCPRCEEKEVTSVSALLGARDFTETDCTPQMHHDAYRPTQAEDAQGN